VGNTGAHDDPSCYSDFIDLSHGERIVGLKADTSFDFTTEGGEFRDGYWRNLQFLVARP